MAEPSQYKFELREVTEALLKRENIHEGVWMVAFELGFGASFGQTNAEAKPGAIVQIQNVILSRAAEPPPPANLLVDASVVNPAQAAAVPEKKEEALCVPELFRMTSAGAATVEHAARQCSTAVRRCR